MSEKPLKRVVVLGAGVIGLTTALRIQEAQDNFQVTIIAETLPSDPKSIRYTSPWAGAHHVSHAVKDDVRQHKIDQDTFDKFWSLSEPQSGIAEECFMRINQSEYYAEKRVDPHLPYPDLKPVEPHQLPPNTVEGVNFTTMTINTPVYLNWLLAQFLSKGGAIVRGQVQHLMQVIEGGPAIFEGKKTTPFSPPLPDAVVVCMGLGARSLGGIEDKTVFPIRGQTLLIRAPWVNFGRTISSKQGLWTYIIPRRNGDVIVGGTKEDDDWYPVPRRETSEDILQRAFQLCPELAPQANEASLTSARLPQPTVEDVRPLIVEEGCGFRPGRKDGIRLEVEYFEDVKNNRRKVPVVHNYGHGGSGYQSSWGSANIAFDLLREALHSKAQ